MNQGEDKVRNNCFLSYDEFYIVFVPFRVFSVLYYVLTDQNTVMVYI
jgi:hypothetical protein